jgi:hypothetical protein
MTSRSRLASLRRSDYSLSAFFAITYVLCIVYGLAFPDQGFHRTLMPMLLPGFAWLTWPAFFIGLAWVFAFGWYVALLSLLLSTTTFTARSAT